MHTRQSRTKEEVNVYSETFPTTESVNIKIWETERNRQTYFSPDSA